MNHNNLNELHALLDSLTDGEHIKAAWKCGVRTVTVEGPVFIDGWRVACHNTIRWADGSIDPSLTSVDVSLTEEVAVTRDDEEKLHALIDSLEEGETVTAEWRDEYGSMILTGPVRISDYGQQVRGYNYNTDVLRWGNGNLHPELHAVTVRRATVKRWEREGDE